MLLSAEARGECALRRRRRKEAGNLGVEHAPPQAVVTALGAARRPQPLRAFFLREHLQPLGLVSEMGSFHRATVRYLPPGLPAALGMLRILRFHSAREMPMKFASVHLPTWEQVPYEWCRAMSVVCSIEKAVGATEHGGLRSLIGGRRRCGRWCAAYWALAPATLSRS